MFFRKCAFAVRKRPPHTVIGPDFAVWESIKYFRKAAYMVYMEMGQHDDIEFFYPVSPEKWKYPAAAGMTVIFDSIDVVVWLSAIDQHGESPFFSLQFLNQYRIAIADVYERDPEHSTPCRLSGAASGTIKYKFYA